MKAISYILFFLYCSVSFCFAGSMEEFKEDFESSVTKLSALKDKINSLSESDLQEYLEETYSSFDANILQETIRELFNKCYSLTKEHHTFSIESNLFDSLLKDNPKRQGQASFTLYCRAIPLLKNLYDKKMRARPNSSYSIDLEECIKALSFYPKYFTNTQEILLSHLKIERIKKKGILDEYAVRIDERRIFFDFRRAGRYALNKIALFENNLEEFNLPTAFREMLVFNIKDVKQAITNSFKINPLARGFEIRKKLNLAELTKVFIPAWGPDDNYLVFATALGIAYNPLLTFTEDGVKLSSEEIRVSQPLFDAWMEKKRIEALPRFYPGKNSQKKNRVVRKKNNSIKSPIVDSAKKSKEIHLFVREWVEKLIEDLPTSTQTSPASSFSTPYPESRSPASSSSTPHLPTASQNDLDDEDPYLFVKKWLTEIIKKAQSQDATFVIFQKALRLEATLEKEPYLLEQVQEATTKLAANLQMFEQESSSRFLFNKVSEKLAPAFLEFMDTPLCYLKNLRFGFIRAFFTTLGIKINTGMEGSRIHFTFRDKHTSIHLHDKHNGELDGGRINSLRKFLIDCGFIYSEMEDSPPQKPTRGGRRR